MYPGRVGQAAHIDRIPGYERRWVVWRDSGGHWQAGAYDPDLVVYVDAPDPDQPELKL